MILGGQFRRMSGTNYKFKKFSRKERRYILSMLENSFSTYKSEDTAYAEMKKYINRWIRLGEILHPGEYKNVYPNTFAAFSMIRNNAKYIKTFNSWINDFREAGFVTNIIDAYSTRPGEFARNIDWVLRKHPDSTEQILEAFENIIDNVSIKLIYELIEYYHKRNDDMFFNNRQVNLKGRRSIVNIKSLYPINETTRLRVLDILLASLKNRFKTKDRLDEYIYCVDKRLENISLPRNMRSMNISLGQQSRGTRIPINASDDVLRIYVRWIDPRGVYDLDLSTYMFDKDFNHTHHMTWNGSCKLYDNNHDLFGVFSGDVRHRVGNSAEYMDISISKAKDAGVRYVIGVVNDFDGSGFNDKEAWCGIMNRTTFGTPGETTWAPETVGLGFSLSSKCTNCLMSIVDLEEMTMIVVDEDLGGKPCTTPMLIRTLSKILKRYSKTPYLNALNLIEMNLKCRGAASINKYDEGQIKLQQEFLKEWNSHKRAEVKKQLDTLKFTLCTDLSDDDRHNITSEFKCLLCVYTCMNNINVISYDDISSDYTKLFEWMF